MSYLLLAGPLHVMRWKQPEMNGIKPWISFAPTGGSHTRGFTLNIGRRGVMILLDRREGGDPSPGVKPTHR